MFPSGYTQIQCRQRLINSIHRACSMPKCCPIIKCVDGIQDCSSTTLPLQITPGTGEWNQTFSTSTLRNPLLTISFFCDIDYDVFRFMELNDKTYGFVINIYDSPQSIPSLWPTTEEYLALHPDAIHPNSAIEWLTDSTRRPGHHRDANGYSTCHFWSNFEIGNLNFWRGERYQNFFDYLDRQGGFFYERWGDAPVHSIGLGLFEDKKKIHWFHDIGASLTFIIVTGTDGAGYNHIPYLNCPASKKCRGCDAGKFFGEIRDGFCVANM